MMNLNEKSMTKLSLVVTFAVLLGACTSKTIKMEASQMALETGDTEMVEVGESTKVANDGYIEIAGAETPYKATKKAKRKGMKSKSVAKKFKKSKKTMVAKHAEKPVASAAATVAQEIEAPKPLDQELSKYPSMDNLDGITVPAPPMEEAAAMAEETSSAFWMYILASMLITIGAGGYVYKTRFAAGKAKGRKRNLVYNG